VGPIVGDAVGKTVGEVEVRVGIIDGIPVRIWVVGAVVGEKVGKIVGEVELCIFVGCSVGEWVGRTDGIMVGVWVVGGTDGEMVGKVVGYPDPPQQVLNLAQIQPDVLALKFDPVLTEESRSKLLLHNIEQTLAAHGKPCVESKYKCSTAQEPVRSVVVYEVDGLMGLKIESQ